MLSRKRSCSWRCCGLRNVPLVQITGWRRFICNHSNRSERGETKLVAAVLFSANERYDSTPPHPLHLLLPQLGNRRRISRSCARLCESCGFHNEGICRRLGIAVHRRLRAQVRWPQDGDRNGTTRSTPSSAWCWTASSWRRPRCRIHAAGRLGTGVWSVWESWRATPKRPGELFSTVTMYPAEETLLLIGDRPGTPDGSPYTAPDRRGLPRASSRTPATSWPACRRRPAMPCWISGRAAAWPRCRPPHATPSHAWGVDIAGRSVRFAEFNRRMNGIENATILRGRSLRTRPRPDLRPDRHPSALRARAEDQDDFQRWRRRWRGDSGRHHSGTAPTPARRRPVPHPGAGRRLRRRNLRRPHPQMARPAAGANSISSWSRTRFAPRWNSWRAPWPRARSA